ncbi:hypothetical protein PT520_09555 [Aliarcobacter butzleri]|uniref:Uncharacterized protein n=1 Tax=Aliarcobacter butzleri TaxID=28197 RepID=A0AAW6VR74_9BACT|nr:hypothetical protein [Aliarcobacter butzleri]MDK2062761.1 hypothetical protein [Aliarcobacter butzleri]
MKKREIKLFKLNEENQMTIKSHKVQKLKEKKLLRKKKISNGARFELVAEI